MAKNIFLTWAFLGVIIGGAYAQENDAATYAGREAGAAWRADAAARIEKYRKGDLRIMVADADGNAVPEAKVHVKMTRHAFAWGSAVAAWCVVYNESEADRERYRQYVADNLNCVVLENDLKWPEWEKEDRRWMLNGTLDWLQKQQLEIRGHCLVWPAWQWLPKRVREMKDDPQGAEKLKNTVLEHIRDEAGEMAGKVCDWDVVNEPYSCRELLDVVGRGEMPEWFREAKKADPAARLFLNDFGILSGAGRDENHQNAYAETIQFLQTEKAPLEGIGMQAHFAPPLTPPERVFEILERFSQFGLPIVITEHDINTKDEQLQADYTRDFLTVAFSHPAVDGILTWGFWQGHHWLPDAALVRKDWTLKPAGEEWRRLVKGEWWTDTETLTDENGLGTVRGFLGDYEITVTHREMTKTVPVKLVREGAEVRVVLERK